MIHSCFRGASISLRVRVGGCPWWLSILLIGIWVVVSNVELLQMVPLWVFCFLSHIYTIGTHFDRCILYQEKSNSPGYACVQYACIPCWPYTRGMGVLFIPGGQVVIYISMTDNEVEHLSRYLFTFTYSQDVLLCEVLCFSVQLPSFSWVFIDHTGDHVCWTNLLLCPWLDFHVWIHSFDELEFLTLVESHWPLFSFMVDTFWLWYEKSLPIPRLGRCSPLPPSKCASEMTVITAVLPGPI